MLNQFDKHYQAHILYGGELIFNMAKIENQITWIITAHFCSDENKRIDCAALIAEIAFSFETKKKTLASLLKKSYPSLLKKYPTLILSLTELQEERNIFAHAELVYPKELMTTFDYKVDKLHFTKAKKFNAKKHAVPLIAKKVDTLNENKSKILGTSMALSDIYKYVLGEYQK